MRTGSKARGRFSAALLSLLAAGCGNLVDMGGNRIADPRRAYVNDPARNDSLATALPGRGVQFVLQPGKEYVLRMKTQATGQKLDFYEPSGNLFRYRGTLTGTREGDVVSFPVSATRDVADAYLAFLRTGSGGRASPPDSAVRLIALDTTNSMSVAVRLLMVRQLKSRIGPGFMGAIEKAQYAQAFHDKLRSVYAAYGIDIDTSTVVVEPDSTPFSVDFGAGFVSIPGARRVDAINLYLIDNIEDGGADGIVLGIAPREAFDLSTDIESRVILNVRGGSPASMAVTAAHEMGHFLGLRHTSATTVDRGYDDDDSNRDDGFASTPFCSSLEKRAAGPVEITRIRSGRAYCLRIAGTSHTCECSDAYNLMYPYACEEYAQDSLGFDQQGFIRKNLKLLQ